MIRLYLIRHGQTPGNKLQRYIGTTDEPLSTEGKEFLEKLTYPMPEALYVSPLCRCVETAGILFPGKSFHIIEELSECDFGEFENKNYKELSEIRIIRGGLIAMERFLFREEKVEKRLSTGALQDFRRLSHSVSATT